MVSSKRKIKEHVFLNKIVKKNVFRMGCKDFLFEMIAKDSMTAHKNTAPLHEKSCIFTQIVSKESDE